MRQFRMTLQHLLHVYAELIFLKDVWSGVVVVLASLWIPQVGQSGLLALLLFSLWRRLLHPPATVTEHNSLLLGLAMGALLPWQSLFFVLLAIGILICIEIETIWRAYLEPQGWVTRCWPFAIGTELVLLAAQGCALPFKNPYWPILDGWNPVLQAMMHATGMLIFTPHPAAGLLVFLAILYRSPYMALLALSGFVIAYLTLHALSVISVLPLMDHLGFNFVLTAMLVGGMYLMPCWQGFTLAMAAVSVTAVLTLALRSSLMLVGLPVLALPFLISSTLTLLTLRLRRDNAAPYFFQDAGMLPEKRWSQSRLALARGSLDLNLYPPFIDEWQVYQGFNGLHTHRGDWRHALDFHQLREGTSFKGDGRNLTDYFCFGQSVLAPAQGYIVAAMDTLPDNPPGEVDGVNNWGNYLILRLDNGCHVILAHIQQHSLQVSIGAWVVAGQWLACCGNSGRSPQPHLHIQVQHSSWLGAPTLPFRLTGAISSQEIPPRFHLSWLPITGDRVRRAQPNTALQKSWFGLVGRTFSYDWQREGLPTERRTLQVIQTLSGELRLISDRSASIAMIRTGELMALHDRQGPADLFLDTLALALAVTPFAEGEFQFADRPPVDWMPRSLLQKLLCRVRSPLGGELQSTFTRQWQRADGFWQQQGHHVLSLPFGKTMTQITHAWLSEEGALMGFEWLSHDLRSSKATLLATGQTPDRGIPAWSHNIPVSSRCLTSRLSWDGESHVL